MDFLQLVDIEAIVNHLAEPSLTKLYQQFSDDQLRYLKIILALQTVTKIIKERFQLLESPQRPESIQPDGDTYENDTLDTTYLLIAIACHVALKDYQTALIIAHFCMSKFFLADHPADYDTMLQTKWLEILCLEKLVQLERCLAAIKVLLQWQSTLKEEVVGSQYFTSFFAILKKKEMYVSDYLKNKCKTLNEVSVDEKLQMSKTFLELVKKQEDEQYFQQHGVFAYLISWEWLTRWKLFTKFYELVQEDPQELKDDLVNKNSQSSLDRRHDIWTALARKLSAEQGEQELIQTYLDLDAAQLQLDITPITNDNLLLLNQPLLQDPWSVKDYCNYKIHPNVKESQDYFYVASYTWRELNKHFGGLEVKRLVNAVDDSELKFSVETHPKLINFIFTPSDTEYMVQMSRNQTIKDFILKIQRIFKLPPQDMKVWKPQNELKLKEFLKYRDLLEGVQLQEKVSLEDSAIGNEDILILEMFSLSTKMIQIQVPQQQVDDSARLQIKNICASCGLRKPELRFCQCYLVKYCDAECQSKDRRRHQDSCKGVTEQSKSLVDKAKKYKIKPPSKITDKSSRGLCGLQNLGNTCFMNSGLQCLSNVYELTEFLVSNQFLNDINEKNALGTGGKLITAYAELLKEIWDGSDRYVSPWQLKAVIGKFASQFSGYSQQDSQEFLTYLLDGIHEDLNRVKHKPYIVNIDYKDQSDEELSQICWDNHLSRNNSVVTKYFTGQFKTKVKCPECNFVSITFDPFVTISLPIPNVEYVVFQFYLIHRDPKQTPQKISLQMISDTSALEILQHIAKKANIESSCLKFYSFKVVIDRQIPDTMTIKELNNINNNVFAYELHEPYPDGERNDKDGIQIQMNLYGRNGKVSQQVSFTRVITVAINLTYHAIQVQIYAYIRPFLIKYVDICGSKEFNEETKILFERIFGDNGTNQDPEMAIIEAEYLMWLALNDQDKVPYKILHDNRALPNSKTRTFIQEGKYTKKDLIMDLKLTFADYIRSDGLGMNKYVDSSFNVVSKSDTAQLSVKNCLELFGKKEILGVGDEWYCSKCKKHQRASKKMQIYKAPKILILHLKRFRNSRSAGHFTQGGSHKISSLIDYPLEQLDLNDQILSRKRDKQIDYTYDLFAVSNHYGGLGGGHYTAFAKNPILDEWFTLFLIYPTRYDFNDSNVHKIKPSQVVTDCAYVLFYRRRGVNEKCKLLTVE